jgi:hypothetical protein
MANALEEELLLLLLSFDVVADVLFVDVIAGDVGLDGVNDEDSRLAGDDKFCDKPTKKNRDCWTKKKFKFYI